MNSSGQIRTLAYQNMKVYIENRIKNVTETEQNVLKRLDKHLENKVLEDRASDPNTRRLLPGKTTAASIYIRHFTQDIEMDPGKYKQIDEDNKKDDDDDDTDPDDQKYDGNRLL